MPRMTDLEISYEIERDPRLEVAQSSGMDAFRQHQKRLDECGFTGDADVVLLGLEDMESEVTMEDAERIHRAAPFVNVDRRRAVGMAPSGIPGDAADVRARGGDIDDMRAMEWDDEG